MTNWTWFWSIAWTRFWTSDVGKVVAIGLFVLSFLATVLVAEFTCLGAMAWVSFAAEMGMATVGFLVGAAISGYQSARNGGDFWAEFANYVNNNWAQTLAITSVMIMASYAVQGVTGNLCFIAGTLVLCMDEDGNQSHKPIEDVKVGDKVWAYDEETGENAWKPVVRLFRNQTKEWYHVFVDGEEIVCTAEHPFYVVDKGFIEAKYLKPNDKLLLSSGKEVILERVEVEKLETAENTYNFEVADFHTYYVAESNVLVHNECKPNFDVMGFDDAAVAEAKVGDPSFSTFKKRLFAAQERLHPGTFDDASVIAENLSPSINGQKIILHHPLGRTGKNLYNVVGVTQQQHLAIHHIIGYRNAKWDLVNIL